MLCFGGSSGLSLVEEFREAVRLQAKEHLCGVSVLLCLSFSIVGLSHGTEAADGVETARQTEDNETESDEVLRWNEVLNRWKRRYDEVQEEDDQAKWRELQANLWTNQVSPQMRGHVIRHCRPDVRREEYLKLTLA